jgi:hypothetical protein
MISIRHPFLAQRASRPKARLTDETRGGRVSHRAYAQGNGSTTTYYGAYYVTNGVITSASIAQTS